MPNVLIIDDDEQICKLLSTIFNRMGYTASYQLTLKNGLDKIISENMDIVFLDVNLPDGNGLDAIEIIKQRPLAPEIIIITADENIDGAELAMRSNAWDYISKRESHKNFKFALERAFEYRKQRQAKTPEKPINSTAIIGDSRLISNCLDKISTAARNDLPVLITGETGTGKELFSKAIHDNSKRSQEEFVVVDCASLPEHLVENTLFGHVKGAFTGADSDKTGLMEMADKGTLFLDEVGELPLDVQKKFLRALQEKSFRPVGSKKEVKSDFRLICATHRDIAAMVKQNKFRKDLFFRLFSMNIHLPPLKDRKEDIIALARHHLHHKKNISEKNCTLSKEFSEELKLYEWPGNVRELLNTMDLVVSEAGYGTTLFPHHLPEHIRAVNIRNKIKVQNNDNTHTLPFSPNSNPKNGEILKLKDHIENTKQAYIRNLLSVTQGNIKESCRISGLSRGHMYRLLQQYNIN